MFMQHFDVMSSQVERSVIVERVDIPTPACTFVPLRSVTSHQKCDVKHISSIGCVYVLSMCGITTH